MKTVLVTLVGLMLISACKKDPIEPDIEQSCSLSFTISPEPTASDSIRFYCPNAFSPNDDALNSQFEQYAIGISTYHCTITQGTDTVFESSDINTSWDGKVAGKTAFGIYNCSFQLMSQKGKAFTVSGQVAALDLTKSVDYCESCLFPDQIEQANGFNLPTNEKVICAE